MMKYMFALVVLLHLCYSVKSNMKVHTEMITGLENLNKCYSEKKVNITSVTTVRVPLLTKHTNASSCMGGFITELKLLLNNMTIHENSTHIIQQLQANLQALGPFKEINVCLMKTIRLPPFRQYANFLKKVNNSL